MKINELTSKINEIYTRPFPEKQGAVRELRVSPDGKVIVAVVDRPGDFDRTWVFRHLSVRFDDALPVIEEMIGEFGASLSSYYGPHWWEEGEWGAGNALIPGTE